MIAICISIGSSASAVVVSLHVLIFSYSARRFLGITIPILPGIMPIQSYGGFKRMTSLCKTAVPDFIFNELEPIKVIWLS
jgi:hypothetical protein